MISTSKVRKETTSCDLFQTWPLIILSYPNLGAFVATKGSLMDMIVSSIGYCVALVLVARFSAMKSFCLASKEIYAILSL